MRSKTHCSTFPIEVLDRDGCTTDREVEVCVDFSIHVDNSYGADADGNRGTRLVEYEVNDIYVSQDVRQTLLEEELAQVLRDAEERFDHSDSASMIRYRANKKATQHKGA